MPPKLLCLPHPPVCSGAVVQYTFQAWSPLQPGLDGILASGMGNEVLQGQCRSRLGHTGEAALADKAKRSMKAAEAAATCWSSTTAAAYWPAPCSWPAAPLSARRTYCASSSPAAQAFGWRVAHMAHLHRIIASHCQLLAMTHAVAARNGGEAVAAQASTMLLDMQVQRPLLAFVAQNSVA